MFHENCVRFCHFGGQARTKSFGYHLNATTLPFSLSSFTPAFISLAPFLFFPVMFLVYSSEWKVYCRAMVTFFFFFLFALSLVHNLWFRDVCILSLTWGGFTTPFCVSSLWVASILLCNVVLPVFPSHLCWCWGSFRWLHTPLPSVVSVRRRECCANACAVVFLLLLLSSVRGTAWLRLVCGGVVGGAWPLVASTRKARVSF